MWQQAFKTPVEEKRRLHLSCLADALNYHFSWGYDEDHTREAGIASTRFLSCKVAGRSFTGTFVGLYASGNGKEMKAQAAFYDFKMRYNFKECLGKYLPSIWFGVKILQMC